MLAADAIIKREDSREKYPVEKGTKGQDDHPGASGRTARGHLTRVGRTVAHLPWRGPLIRTATVVADYLVALFSVSVLVPLVGVVLFNMSGVNTATGINAQITFWVAPFLLAVAFIAAGALWVMRSLWRLGTRIIERTAAHRDSDIDPSTSSVA